MATFMSSQLYPCRRAPLHNIYRVLAGLQKRSKRKISTVKLLFGIETQFVGRLVPYPVTTLAVIPLLLCFVYPQENCLTARLYVMLKQMNRKIPVDYDLLSSNLTVK
jgi:hypothetical protein